MNIKKINQQIVFIECYNLETKYKNINKLINNNCLDIRTTMSCEINIFHILKNIKEIYEQRLEMKKEIVKKVPNLENILRAQQGIIDSDKIFIFTYLNIYKRYLQTEKIQIDFKKLIKKFINIEIDDSLIKDFIKLPSIKTINVNYFHYKKENDYDHLHIMLYIIILKIINYSNDEIEKEIIKKYNITSINDDDFNKYIKIAEDISKKF